MAADILLPLDGLALSEQILPLAQQLARGLDATLRLVHVIDAKAEDGVAALPAALLQEERRRAQAYLDALQSRLAAGGLRVAGVLREGSPGETIAKMARGQHVELLAMSTHSSAAAPRWVVGSVAERLLHSARAPLLLFRPQAEGGESPPPITSLLVPLDGSAIGERVLPLALRLAQGLGVGVRLAQVVGGYTFSFYDDAAAGQSRALAEVVQRRKAEAERYLEGQRTAFTRAGIATELTVMVGDIDDTLLALSDQPGVLTVMSTRGWAGSNAYLLGKVTNRLVRASVNPLVVVSHAPRLSLLD